jgi:hypothetical protein
MPKRDRLRADLLFDAFEKSFQVTIRLLQFCGHERAEHYLRQLRPVMTELQDELEARKELALK